jgi:hypothetical protein
VGGEIHPWYEKDPPRWFTDDIEVRTWGNKKGYLRPPRAVYGFSGSNMAFRKDILESHGGFSSSYGPVGNRVRFGEEPELFARIYKDNPLFWYDPSIRVLHWVPCRRMTIFYRLKRTYHIGIANADLHRKESGSVLHACLRIALEISKFPFRVHWWKKYWQRDLLKYTLPIAMALGDLTSIFSRRVSSFKDRNL